MRGLGLALLTVTVASQHLTDTPRLLIQRIGPSACTIHIANADGSGERQLLTTSGLDYNASLSPDGQAIVFTSERDGSADLYRARVDGSGLERLTSDPAYDDQASWSPDGKSIAFVSTRGSGTTDIWVLDVATRRTRNLTAHGGGDFRPSWSPDGQWIVFSSDRGTQVERKPDEWGTSAPHQHLPRAS